MIGIMYRPLKILNLHNRGFYLLIEYVSWSKSKEKFEMEISLFSKLSSDYTESSDEVHIHFRDLAVPVLVDGSYYDPKRKSTVTTNEGRLVRSMRKISRPTKITSRDGLKFTMLIKSPKDESENDVLEVAMEPVVIENKEYMKVSAKCMTPVVVSSKATKVFSGL